MHVEQISPEAANSLINGYCDDFISLAAVLAQTLEQVSMRGIDISDSADKLNRISSGMGDLSEAIKASIASIAQKASAQEPRRCRSESRQGNEPALKGNNRSMPIRSVFQFIERMRKTGVIKVKLPDETLRFDFEQGSLIGCTTTNLGKSDRLGDLLIGICDQDLMETVLRSADTMDNTQVGEMVLRAGIATPRQVTQALEAQLRQRFGRACDAKTASYVFVETAPSNNDSRVRFEQPAGS